MTGSRSIPAMEREVRIATFNLENLSDDPASGTTLADRCRVLRPQLARLAADVLCLQEVGAERDGPKGTPRRFRALEALLDGTDYAGFHRVHSTLKNGRGPLDIHNLVILSRYPIARHEQLWNALVSPPRYRYRTAEPEAPRPQPVAWDRPALHAEITLQGGCRMHVFNLHLRAPLAAFIPGQKTGAFSWRTTAGWAEGFFVAAVKRSGQALEVRFAIDRIFDARPDAWIAVCGDMNAELREMPLRILRGDGTDTENPALDRRTMIPMESAAPEARRYSVIHGGRAAMLDHMLVSRPLFDRFERIEIHNEALKDELRDYRRSANLSESHHAPVVACFDPTGGAGRGAGSPLRSHRPAPK